jgi:Tfp pilus assembly protein FimT
MVIVLAVVGTLLGITFARLHQAIDSSAVRSAAQDASTAFSYARSLAVTRRQAVAVRIDTTLGRLLVYAAGDTVVTRALADRYGVRLQCTRDSMAFDLRGLGYGAANLSVIFRRGTASETLYVARLGRIRR